VNLTSIKLLTRTCSTRFLNSTRERCLELVDFATHLSDPLVALLPTIFPDFAVFATVRVPFHLVYDSARSWVDVKSVCVPESVAQRSTTGIRLAGNFCSWRWAPAKCTLSPSRLLGAVV